MLCACRMPTNISFDDLLDQAIWPVHVDAHDGQICIKELTTYFGPLVEQGRRLVRDGADEEEDVEEEDEASEEAL